MRMRPTMKSVESRSIGGITRSTVRNPLVPGAEFHGLDQEAWSEFTPAWSRGIRSGPDSVEQPGLAQIAQHARVDEVRARRGGDRVHGCRLAGLWQAAGQRFLAPMEGARQPVGHVSREVRACKDEAPRADRRERRVESRVRARGDRHPPEERVLREDTRDLVGAGRDEARPRPVLGQGGEARPARAAAPERRDAPVEHHRGPVARAVEVHGVEVALLVEAEAVEDVAREDHEAGARRAEGEGLAPEVGDRAVRAVGPDDEHAGRGVHRRQDLQVGRWAADAGERLVDDLALEEGEVELPRREERHVLGAALRVARLDRERRVDRVDRLGNGGAVDGEPAARRRGPQDDDEGRQRLQHARYATTASRYTPAGGTPMTRSLCLAALLLTVQAPAAHAEPVQITIAPPAEATTMEDRKSTRLNSSHSQISYAVFCLKKKKYTKLSRLCVNN